jgi:hypothetical protein
MTPNLANRSISICTINGVPFYADPYIPSGRAYPSLEGTEQGVFIGFADARVLLEETGLSIGHVRGWK